MTDEEQYEESYRIVRWSDTQILAEGLSYEEARRRCDSASRNEFICRERPELLTDAVLDRLPRIHLVADDASLQHAMRIEARAGNEFARQFIALQITARRYLQAVIDGDVAVPVTAIHTGEVMD